jgi:hypothetical protein
MIVFEQVKWQDESNNASINKNKFVLRIIFAIHMGRSTSNSPTKPFSQYKNEG